METEFFLLFHIFHEFLVSSKIVLAVTSEAFAINSTVISSSFCCTFSSSSPLVVMVTSITVRFSFHVTISMFPYELSTRKPALAFTLYSLLIFFSLVYLPFGSPLWAKTIPGTKNRSSSVLDSNFISICFKCFNFFHSLNYVL